MERTCPKCGNEIDNGRNDQTIYPGKKWCECMIGEKTTEKFKY